MTCADFRQDLYAFLDQELPSKLELACRDHVSECDNCQALVESEDPTAMFSRIGSAHLPEPSEAETMDFLAAVQSGIAQRQAERPVSSSRVPHLTRLSWAAIFILGAMAMGLLLNDQAAVNMEQPEVEMAFVPPASADLAQVDQGTPGIESLDKESVLVMDWPSREEGEPSIHLIFVKNVDI